MRIAFEKIQTFYLLLSLTIGGLFLRLATVCYFSDSEIWLLATSKKAFSVGDVTSVYYKWFFHAVVFVTSFWTQNNLLIYEISRIVFALLSLSSILLIAASFSKIYQKKQLFLPIVLICLTSSLFFNQGFRIRADNLALFLHASFLFLVFQDSTNRRKHILLLISLHLALLLTTPKALIFITMHLIIGCYLCTQSNEDKKQTGKTILISILSPLTIALFAMSCLAFIQPEHPLFYALQSAGDFYLKSFDHELGGARFFKSSDFMYLLRFLQLSLVHTFLFVAWLVLFFINVFSKRKNSLHSFFNIYGACLLSMILLYNQKLPFFLGPFLTPLIALQYCSLDHFISSRALSKWMAPALLAGACWFCCKQFMINLQFNNNDMQKEFISQLQTYKTEHPDVLVYDIIGLLPQDNTYYLFIGPGEVTRNREILSKLQQNPPDIYLYTFKNIFFNNELQSFLQENYFEYQPGVWLKAKHLKTDHNFSQSNKVIQFNSKNYWLLPFEQTQTVFSHTAKKDITADCLFLDSGLKTTQTATQWLGIPLEHLHFSLTKLAPTKFSQNPYIVFRFDTAF